MFRKSLVINLFVSSLFCVLSTVGSSALAEGGVVKQQKEKKMTVTDGMLVSIEYTLKDDEGNTLDSNVGGDALKYTQGAGQIVPGLEKELLSLAVGQEKKVTVAAKDAYGEVDSKAFIEVPKEKIPEGAHKVGAMLQTSGPGGQAVNAMVSEVKPEVIVLNFNHPLAGKNLHFDVKILALDIAPENVN